MGSAPAREVVEGVTDTAGPDTDGRVGVLMGTLGEASGVETRGVDTGTEPVSESDEAMSDERDSMIDDAPDGSGTSEDSTVRGSETDDPSS